jgi:hypothetical protein
MKSYGIILFALVSNMVSAAPATDATFKQTSRDEILRRKVMRALAHERGPAPTYGTCVNSQPYSNDMGIYATFSDAAPSGEVSRGQEPHRAHRTDRTTGDNNNSHRPRAQHGCLRRSVQ